MLSYKTTCDNMKERYDKVIILQNHGDVLLEMPKPQFEKIATTALTFTDPLKNGLRIQMNHITKKHEYATLHSYGYIGFFKPDLGEILSQLPAEIFDRDVVYLSVDLGTPTDVNIYDENHRVYNYHNGITTIYYF